jgi:membrane-associated phospholipid phosphatase
MCVLPCQIDKRPRRSASLSLPPRTACCAADLNSTIPSTTAGTYFSSLLKDLVQVPRPLVPPVTRLSLEYHHLGPFPPLPFPIPSPMNHLLTRPISSICRILEYGFPSSHSTSSTSLALHFSYLLLRSSPLIVLSTPHLILAHLALFLFWTSVVFGRIYCGMHSFVDCAAGCLLGAGLSWGVIATGWRVDGWLDEGGWNVPITIFLLTTLLSSLRPKPPVPCPCFGDAVSFVSVVSGIVTGRYFTTTFNLADLFLRPASSSPSSAGGGGGSWLDLVKWVSWAGGKYLLGEHRCISCSFPAF